MGILEKKKKNVSSEIKFQENDILIALLKYVMYNVTWTKRNRKKNDGHIWRCLKNRNHEFGLRQFSFFEGANVILQDGVQFIRSF